MDNEEITISSTSNKTADMTPIVILDETTRTQVRFELQQIDNEKDSEKKLKGKFIYTVANKKTGSFDDIIRLNKNLSKREKVLNSLYLVKKHINFGNI